MSKNAYVTEKGIFELVSNILKNCNGTIKKIKINAFDIPFA
jgi:hypothetical protein